MKTQDVRYTVFWMGRMIARAATTSVMRARTEVRPRKTLARSSYKAWSSGAAMQAAAEKHQH
jgi:hypothetical protein